MSNASSVAVPRFRLSVLRDQAAAFWIVVLQVDEKSSDYRDYSVEANRVLGHSLGAIAGVQYGLRATFRAQPTPCWTVPMALHVPLCAALQAAHVHYEAVPDRVLEMCVPRDIAQSEARATKTAAEARLNRCPLYRTLYPYQQVGVRFVVAQGGRAIIGDEMGLGKTRQALMLIAYYSVSTLIVCPASLKTNWQTEYARHVGTGNGPDPGFEPGCPDATKHVALPEQAAVLANGTAAFEPVSIISYGLLVTDKVAARVDATGRKVEEFGEEDAVERGYVTTLKCLRRRGRLSEERLLCAAAARTGDLEALKALRCAENFPWDERTCSSAAAAYSLGFLNSNSSTFRPVASTASRMPLLTARSTARSAGSGRCFSTIETATSKGRPGIATPACESRSRFRLRARVSTPHDAPATIAGRAACTARVVVCVWRAPRATLCAPRRMRSEIRDFSKLFLKIGLFISSLLANASKFGARRACLCSSEVYMSPTEGTSHPSHFSPSPLRTTAARPAASLAATTR